MFEILSIFGVRLKSWIFIEGHQKLSFLYILRVGTTFIMKLLMLNHKDWHLIIFFQDGKIFQGIDSAHLRII